ncbi:MAG: hypothetical protein JOZ10_19115 [Acidobacteria bacterium]|nr:hypothetical protein [Acidobacteriota bacterium]MBV9146519.1 hypothetical protein [Acidobacteriota bacterium]MBV9435461.1 hypothetical protein [Acidobacteriota bacterium]
MFLKKENRNPKLVLQAGLWTFVLAGFLNMFLHPTARVGDGVIDGVKGLCYGLSFGLLLLSLLLRRKGASNSA